MNDISFMKSMSFDYGVRWGVMPLACLYTHAQQSVPGRMADVQTRPIRYRSEQVKVAVTPNPSAPLEVQNAVDTGKQILNRCDWRCSGPIHQRTEESSISADINSNHLIQCVL